MHSCGVCLALWCSVMKTGKIRNLSSHIDMHTHDGSTLHNPLTLSFDLCNACQCPAIVYMFTKFGVDSSSHFLLRVQTHTGRESQMSLNIVPTRRILPLWVITVTVVWSCSCLSVTIVWFGSLEIVRLCHNDHISSDMYMTAMSCDGAVAAKPRTVALSEELGQIRFILSDKTGTLTQVLRVCLCCYASTCKNFFIFGRICHPLWE